MACGRSPDGREGKAAALSAIAALAGLWLALPGTGWSQQAPGNSTAPYGTLVIAQPQDQQTVFDNNGVVDVVVSISPPLRGGERVVLLVDGKAAARQAGTAFRLTGVDRGTHSLQAQLVSGEGRLVISSAPVTFYLWHASRQFPNAKKR